MTRATIEVETTGLLSDIPPTMQAEVLAKTINAEAGFMEVEAVEIHDEN